MTTPAINSPADALDALRERARTRGTSSDASAHGYDGWAARFQFEDSTVPDQSVAFPDRRVELRSDIYVIAPNDGSLVLRLVASWRSIFGRHVSTAKYVVNKDGESNVTIAPTWEQTIPVSRLDQIDVHTGNVSSESYHQQVLDTIRGDGSRAGSAMLWTGADRAVDAGDLIELAAMVYRMTPSL